MKICSDVTLETILVDITDGCHSEAEPRPPGASQHEGRALLEGSVLVHIDVHCSSFLLLAVKVKRCAYDQVVPA